jgi:hypothetical protein
MAIRTMSADGTVNISDWFHTTAGWSQRRFIEDCRVQRPDAAGPLPEQRTTWRALKNRIGGIYNFNYDILHHRYLQQRMMTYYNSQCCGFAVGVPVFKLPGAQHGPGDEGQPVQLHGDAGRNRHVLESLRLLWRNGRHRDRHAVLTRGRGHRTQVLVTGGAGFIGSNFVRHALASAPRLAHHDAPTS